MGEHCVDKLVHTYILHTWHVHVGLTYSWNWNAPLADDLESWTTFWWMPPCRMTRMTATLCWHTLLPIHSKNGKLVVDAWRSNEQLTVNKQTNSQNNLTNQQSIISKQINSQQTNSQEPVNKSTVNNQLKYQQSIISKQTNSQTSVNKWTVIISKHTKSP